jgi:hypothetical protein
MVTDLKEVRKSKAPYQLRLGVGFGLLAVLTLSITAR